MWGRLRNRRQLPIAAHHEDPAAVARSTVNDIVLNLARRSQTLVERQLRLLDELERDEKDPDRMAALFRLEHLAARMRRTNENLLVLAGGAGRRRTRQAVPLAALVLAAVAEIEQYQRVRAEVEDGLDVVGYAAADLVHLIAELLDNAATFSPPVNPVRVVGRRVRDGAELTITDEGIGFEADAMAEANVMLAAPPSVDAAVTERMGLVVVGHLAARHGALVRITPANPGTSVTITLLKRLLADGAEVVQPRPSVAERNPIDETTVRLPLRVPMANLPTSEPQGVGKSSSEPTAVPVLTRLYNGLRGSSGGNDTIRLGL